MKVRYRYRLRPGRVAERYLLREWDACRFVWNELVATNRDIHTARHTIALVGAAPVTFGAAQQDKLLTHLRATVVDQDGVKWLAAGSSVAQQQTVRDYASSRAAALTDRTAKKGRAGRGMPQFKKRGIDRPSMNYTQRGFSIKTGRSGANVLVLPGKVQIPVVWSRELPNTPSSVRVSQDSLGHWYASFVVDAPEVAAPEVSTPVAIGVDWGVAEIATTTRVHTHTGDTDESATYDLAHPGHRTRAQAKLTVAQRAMSRRKPARGKPASKGYLRAKKTAAKAHLQVARRRQDDARKWAKKLVQDHDQIAVENFRPKFLAKTTMAKKSADGAIGIAMQELIWQALKAKRDLRLVNPANTTTDCYSCGTRATHRLPLGQRTYTCATCGISRPRDKNSAAVMVARAGFVPAHADGRRPGPRTRVDLAA